MSNDRMIRGLLVAGVALLAANLFVSLNGGLPAAHARDGEDPYSVIVLDVNPKNQMERFINERAKKGYHYKDLVVGQSSLWVVMERDTH